MRRPARFGAYAVIGSLLATMLLLIGVATPAQAAAPAWPVLSSGQSGAAVLTVQRMLRERGATLTADGAFGAVTRAAVESFQSATGLTADGVVGPLTWGRLVVPLDTGATGEAVRALQEQLTRHGKAVAADGVFGSATGAAVASFKTDNGLGSGAAVDATVWQWLVGGSSATGYGGRISRTEVLARAEDWWIRQVPYSQSSYAWDVNHGKTYRQDCSGFISMTWKLTSSRTTYTLDEVSTAIAWADLTPGDMVLAQTHVKLFEKWANDAHTVMWIYEQGSSSSDMDHETVSVSTLSANGYRPYRYVNIY